MSFYVYENWTIDKAVIHCADCSYCNDGAGIHAEKGDDNGTWHGAFATFAEAKHQAELLRREDCRSCKVCRPEKYAETEHN